MSSSTADLPTGELIDRMGGFPPPYWRSVLQYFDDQEREVATIEDLTTYLHDQDPSIDESRILIHLHHSTLPKLAASGVLDYDPRTNTVRVADFT